MMIEDVLQGGGVEMTLQPRVTSNLHRRNFSDVTALGYNQMGHHMMHDRAGSAGMTIDYYNSSRGGINTIDYSNYGAGSNKFL